MRPGYLYCHGAAAALLGVGLLHGLFLTQPLIWIALAFWILALVHRGQVNAGFDKGE